jgi:hypothetical protein
MVILLQIYIRQTMKQFSNLTIINFLHHIKPLFQIQDIYLTSEAAD